MKSLKKFGSVALALLCACCMSVPLGAFAEDEPELIPMETLEPGDGIMTTYDPCDVDHNGTVNIIDALEITHFLLGYTKVPQYYQLDANRNLIVDDADRECVIAAVIHSTYSGSFLLRNFNHTTGQLGTPSTSAFPTVSTPYVVDPKANTNGFLQYKRYVYNSNSPSTGTVYTLNPSQDALGTTSGEQINKTTVVDGVDSRYSTTLPENKGIVLITAKDDKNYIHYFTGFIVGSHKIATCAHGLYHRETFDLDKDGKPSTVPSYFYTSITVTPYNANGTLNTSAQFHPIAAHIPDKYDSAEGQPIYDYALITVSESLPNSSYPYFTIGNYYNFKNISNYSNVPVYVTGKPGEVRDQAVSTLYSERGSFTAESNQNIVHFNTDMSEGDSGSPVYTITKNVVGNGTPTYSYTALSICSGGLASYDHGPRFTREHLAFYFNNADAKSDYSSTTQ